LAHYAPINCCADKRCTYCGKSIVWVRTAASGSWMPVDAEPSSDGKVVIDGLGSDARAHVIAPTLFDRDEWPSDTVRRTSHFATCPKADQARRPRARKS